MTVAHTAIAQQVANASAHEERIDTATMLNRRVTLQLHSVPLERALDAVAAAARVQMQYRNKVVDVANRPVSLNVKQMPLRAVFPVLFAGTRLEATPIGRNTFSIEAAVNSIAAADGGIHGTVIDAATKRPLVGVIIKVEGTKIAVLTGEDGVYHIASLTLGKHTLVARRIGYSAVRTGVVVLDNDNVAADIALSPSATTLDEVVTTVTGPQRRLELGNSIGIIKADSLVKEAPIFTLSQLLTSRVPGLKVSQGQGTVGGNVRLQIRGLSTIAQGSEPIVIVDGIRYNSRPASVIAGVSIGDREPVSPLNDINPNDIETIDVVKGPSAATLYGTDASNGVIVITTKRGKPGPTQWSVHGSKDYNEIPRRRVAQDDVYSGWGTFVWGEPTTRCSLRAEFLDHTCTQDSVTHAPSAGTNDDLSVLKPSQSWTSGASVSGGQQKLRYFVSGNYNSFVGALGVPDSALRLARARGLSNFSEAFFRPNSQNQLNFQSNVSASAGEKGDLSLITGYTRGNTRSIDVRYDAFNVGVSQNDNSCGLCLANKIVDLLSRTSEELNDRLFSNVNGTAQLASWLSANATVGLDWSGRNQSEFQERDSTSSKDPLGRAVSRRTRSALTTANGGATLVFRPGWASFRTSVGTGYVRSTIDVVEAIGTDLLPGTTSIRFASNRSSNELYDQSVTLGSYLEETFGMYDRLFLTAAVRVDGASGFGDHYRTATYPKISASWLVSQEPLFPRIAGLTDMRLRAAYGVAGRQARSTDKLPSLFVRTTDAPGYGSLVDLSSIGNPELRPERSTEFEGGVDATLLEQRVQLGLTWYRRSTTDLIVGQTMPSGLDYHSRNIGLVRGSGVEAQLTTTLVDTRPLSLAFTFGHSKTGTTLVRLGTAQSNADVWGGYKEGYPLGVRFERPYVSFTDINDNGVLELGTPEVVQSDTAQFAGLVQAPIQQTLTLNVGLMDRRLRLSANFNREKGGTGQIGYDCNQCRAAYDRTAPLEEQVAYIAGLYPVRMDFTRLREITAALTLPSVVTRAIHASTSTVALSARNLALWTSYKGLDPESRPIDYAVTKDALGAIGIPQSRTWTVRFDLGL